jgi:hypothetical protein
MNIEHCPFNVGIHADEERKENGQYIYPRDGQKCQ